MIKDMLWPLIKRYYKLFLSMVFVSAIAVALLAGFPSTVKNSDISFEEFKKDCGYADCVLQTELAPRKYADKLSIVDGVEEVNQRIGIAAYMKTKEGAISTSMVCSYLDEDFYNRHILKETEKSQDMINVSVEKRYAENNNIKVGDIIELFIYGTKIDAYVSSIVYTPETIYVIANQYLMPDNTAFGYIFIEDEDLAQAVKKSEAGSFELFWEDFFGGLIKNGKLRYSNQVLIKCKEGVDRKVVLSACEKELSKHVKVTSSAVQEQTTSAAYMDRSDKGFMVVARTFPEFFYVIVLFIVVMFLNQMVIDMTRDIGVLRALGTSRASITKLLCTFSFLMSIGAVILGWIVAIFMCDFTTKKIGEVYQLPLATTKLDPKMVIIAFIVTVAVGQIAAVIAGLKANKITPKEAMNNNEGNKKNLSDRIERVLDIFSPEKKLSLCIGIQNPRRVIVSVFAIAAAFMLLFISISYKDSKDSIITQIMGERYKFDLSFSSTDNNSSKLYRRLSEIEGVDEIETVKYMTVNAEGPKAKAEISICGVDPEGHMLLFPDEKGRVGNVKIEKDGIWLNKDEAEIIGIQAGDMVVIEGVPIEVKGLSHDYMNFISAVSLEQMEKIPAKEVTTFLLNVSDRSALESFLLEQNEASVICSYENMNKDISMRLRPLDILVVIMVVFSILMAVIILVMMAQSSLLEQKRLICTMKVLGFSSGDISRMWLRQEAVYTVAGIAVGIPLAILFYRIILKSANNYAWSFPIETKLIIIVISVAIVVATVTITHFLSMRLTKKWNLAESTKDRE